MLRTNHRLLRQIRRCEESHHHVSLYEVGSWWAYHEAGLRESTSVALRFCFFTDMM